MGCDCRHDGDRWWDHAEERSYCCMCRKPVPRVVPKKKEWVNGGRIRAVQPFFGEHYDHYGYPCAPGRTGGDQT